MPRKALGRGLDALLPEDTTAATVKLLPVESISKNPYQPRHKIGDDEIAELVESIKSKGVLQPVLVRESDTGYELVAGERRWLAARKAGLDRIPALVIRVSDREALEIALIENLQRHDLNPVEEAIAYRRLMDEFGLTQQEVAEKVAKDRSTVANRLRLLNLHPDVIEMLASGDITEGHARTLLRVPYDKQPYYARLVVERGLSVRELERLLQSSQKRRKKSEGPFKDVELLVAEKAGLAARIKIGRKGKGKIELKFKNVEQLARIISNLTGEDVTSVMEKLKAAAPTSK